jgi:lipopolysaccharide export system protein LptA
MKKGIFCLLLLFSVNCLFSQSIPLEVVNVDRTSVDELLYPGAQKLQGNIHFKQGDAHLYCDSGYFYPSQNRLLAKGQVRLIQEAFKATCFELDYSGETRLALLQGGVQLTEGNQRLRTQRVEYRTDTRVGSYRTKGQIDAPGIRATSDSGYFYRDLSLVLLIGNAQIEDKTVSIKADSIGFRKDIEQLQFFQKTKFLLDGQKGLCNGGFYSKLNQQATLLNGVRMTDSAGNELQCDTFVWNKKLNSQEVRGPFSLQDSSKSQCIWGNYLKRWATNDSIFVSKNVLVRWIDEKDTTYLFTDTLTGNPLAYFSFPENHLKNDSTLGICGFLKYNKADSSIFLEKNPMIWNDDFQVSAQRMVQKKSGKKQWVECFDSCFVLQWVDCCHTNQIKSDSLVLTFSTDQSKEMLANGRVSTIYYDVTGKKIERETEVQAEKLTAIWEAGKIKFLSYQQHPKIKLQRPEKKGKKLDGMNPKREKYFEELFFWAKINRTY